MQTAELGPSLLRALAAVPDPRSRHGRRHPLPAVLALATVAMRSGARSLYAIAQGGREQPEAVVRTLGFTRQQTPSVATRHRVFKGLEVEVFEVVLGQWAQAALGGRGEVIASEGKALRGLHGEQVPGVRLVAAYEVQTGLVLAQGGVRQETALSEAELAEGKARAELSVAPAVLRRVPVRGRLVTGDALYCQRAVCAQSRRAGGPSLFVLKANQPELVAEVTLLFDQPPPGERFAMASSRRTQRERHEVRTLTASAALADYLAELGWAGAQPVARLESCVTHVRGVRAGQTTQLVRYFLTSLGPHVPARQLLRLIRAHWHIENRLQYVRDVTLGEDASQVRSGTAPQALAALRTAVLGLLRQHDYANIAAALRHFAWSPGAGLRLLGLSSP